MSIKKSHRELLLDHFGAATPVLVVQGTGLSPDWSCVARLGDLMESLIPERGSNYENPDAKVGLVLAAPFGLNLPGRVIEIVRSAVGAASFAELGLAAFARARAEVAPDATDAADELRHRELILQLCFQPGI